MNDREAIEANQHLHGAKDILDMLDNPEELHPDLAEAKRNNDDVGTWIHHPLLIAPFYVPQMNRIYNAQYEAKRQALGRAKGTKDWNHYVFLHERPYRIDAFQDLDDQGLLSDQEYWSLLADVWVDSENIREFPDRWESLLASERGHRHSMMQEDELTEYACLPEVIYVYQGHTVDRDDGWSWTTDLAKAEWFARRFASMEGDAPLVTHGNVEKRRIHAYLTRRGESEVLVDPEWVIVNKVVGLRDE